ncbi:flagellar filament capping protein FliD [Polynucleobacter sp. Nonnen-W13]|uniref:flagellar filament capping protein FliD n=1 Tax=Polynucleobacter sp. Nonnen-W13 TaxID=1855625 RepID=UPI001C0BD48D|nr:flagellar filament capping protein FliD [Polynucleobacter sp. Nonnen-W13]MBU3558475.1 flagellar filament capping protein FliD [Polynucleobacter sp. Nonnen-W13]
MATSSVSNNTSTSSIDVAGMVAGLMSVENKPLTTLQSKITSQTTLISDLGQLKSKVAAFQTALQAAENPLSYSAAVASSSNESAVKVSSTTGANIGSHQITVSQLAKPAQYIFNNFGSSNASVGFANASQFDLTIAGVTKSLAVSSATTIGDLSSWINGLGLGVAASVTQTASNQYALMIQGTQSGVANNITFGVNGALNSLPVSSTAATASPPATGTSGNQAQDAIFTLDNVSFSRTSNIVSDVHPGLVLNLVSSGSAATITVANGTDNGQEVIQRFIAAFNDLATTSKKLAQKGDSSTAAGSLAGSPGAVSFMSQIKSMLSTGVTYNSASGSNTLGLYQLGIEIQSDGTLQFNSVKYGSTENISAILASGINMGSTTFTDRTNNLNAFLTSQVQSGGDLSKSISNEQTNLTQMSQKEEALKIRLDAKEKSYISQYSSLNALLFKLNQTSNSLTSALDGLVNGQNNR